MKVNKGILLGVMVIVANIFVILAVSNVGSNITGLFKNGNEYRYFNKGQAYRIQEIHMDPHSFTEQSNNVYVNDTRAVIIKLNDNYYTFERCEDKIKSMTDSGVSVLDSDNNKNIDYTEIEGIDNIDFKVAIELSNQK